MTRAFSSTPEINALAAARDQNRRVRVLQRVGRVERPQQLVVGSVVGRLVAAPHLQRDLHESIASINVVLKHVSEGEGYPHKFITDKAEAERISRTFDTLDKAASAQFPKASIHVHERKAGSICYVSLSEVPGERPVASLIFIFEVNQAKANFAQKMGDAGTSWSLANVYNPLSE